jgi:hypothetical protein
MRDKKKYRASPLSRFRYVRRSEDEMRQIIEEITSGALGIRAACVKYGLNRNTLKLWMTRLAVRALVDKGERPILSAMGNKQKEADCKNEIKRLTKALEYARLRIVGLETMIKVTEEDLQIKIRKKPGTKRSKE